jgi:hypothetical protein
MKQSTLTHPYKLYINNGLMKQQHWLFAWLRGSQDPFPTEWVRARPFHDINGRESKKKIHWKVDQIGI